MIETAETAKKLHSCAKRWLGFFLLWGTATLFAAPRAVNFPEVSPPTHDIRMENRVPVQMRDGTVLYADVYRPVKDGKYPVIVSRTPYGVELTYAAPVFFARRGYVFVWQDVRGRFESEGKWDPFRQEDLDGFDTIEWAARQPWSNGKVGMQGKSYLGHVQWQAAKTLPPHLVTIFPDVAPTSIYHHAVTLNGGWRLSLAFGWGAVRAESRIGQNPGVYSQETGLEHLSYDQIVWHLPLIEMPKLAGRNSAFYTEWIRHPDYDDYWKAISVEEHYAKLSLPAHTFGGWFDILTQGTINGYVGMAQRGKTVEARQGSQMVIGPWGHGPSQKFGDLDFGPQAMVDVRALELRWFDYWLKGIENGLRDTPPVTLFVMGANRWRYENEYPIARTNYREMYLHSAGKANSVRGDGRLSWSAPLESPPDVFLYDPRSPVPSLGGSNCCGTPTIVGPVDQRSIESREDVLVYTSDVLGEPVEVTGPVKLVLHAASDAPDTDFVAKLVDVYPDGRAINVAEGILRARHREGIDRPKLMEPGRIYSFSIDLVATSNMFEKGHRIQLDVTSSHFPQFDRNPNTGEPFGLSSKLRTATQTVHHSPAYPSHLLLPVIPASGEPAQRP
ncbi:MAG: CocE/NonD family hydrolase [Acidimicrobiia bacterium]|nr:CocE/NonD family hydrolase [Acidimicrobiia bacterium]